MKRVNKTKVAGSCPDTSVCLVLTIHQSVLHFTRPWVFFPIMPRNAFLCRHHSNNTNTFTLSFKLFLFFPPLINYLIEIIHCFGSTLNDLAFAKPLCVLFNGMLL